MIDDHDRQCESLYFRSNNDLTNGLHYTITVAACLYRFSGAAIIIKPGEPPVRGRERSGCNGRPLLGGRTRPEGAQAKRGLRPCPVLLSEVEGPLSGQGSRSVVRNEWRLD